MIIHLFYILKTIDVVVVVSMIVNHPLAVL